MGEEIRMSGRWTAPSGDGGHLHMEGTGTVPPGAVPPPSWGGEQGPPRDDGQQWGGAQQWGGGQQWRDAPAKRPPWGLILGGIAGLLILIVAIAAGLAFFGGMYGSAGLEVGPDGDVSAFDLEPGDCADGEPWEGGSWSAGDTVPCDAPHDLEVYTVAALPGMLGDRYPDAAVLAVYADAHCELAFEPYVDRSWLSSQLDYVALLPSPSAWQDGDREIRCALFSMDGDQLTGSAANSGW
jgi:hypothetical protein